MEFANSIFFSKLKVNADSAIGPSYYRNVSKIFHLRLSCIKNLNSIFDTESKNKYFIGSNKYIITKIECWPVFKQDPIKG